MGLLKTSQLVAPLECDLKLEKGLRTVKESLSHLHAAHHENHASSVGLSTELFREAAEHTRQHNQLHTFVEGECETLSQEVQTLRNLSADHFSKLAKLESHFDTEASISRAKFDELGASLKSEWVTCHEPTARTAHDLEQVKIKINQDDTACDVPTISQQELTSSHAELSASRQENQEMDTERGSHLESPLEADPLCLDFKAAEESLRFEKRCTGLESLVQEQQILQQKLESMESACKPSFQHGQEHYASETKIMHQQLSKSLSELLEELETDWSQLEHTTSEQHNA